MNRVTHPDKKRRHPCLGIPTWGILVVLFFCVAWFPCAAEFLHAQEILPLEDSTVGPREQVPASSDPRGEEPLPPAEEPGFQAFEGTGPASSQEGQAPEQTGLPPEGSSPIPSVDALQEGGLAPLETSASAAAPEVHLRMIPKKQWLSLSPAAYTAREHRILPEGLFIDQLTLQRFRNEDGIEARWNHFLLLEDLGQGRIMKDSSGVVTWNRYGTFVLTADFQKTPHLYADGLQGSLKSFSSPRDQGHLDFKFTPGNQLTLHMDLSVEERRGERPLPTENVATLVDGKIASTAIVEIAEPIHAITTSLTLGAEYSDGPVDILLENRLQTYNPNRGPDATWDNPVSNLPGKTGAVKLPDDYWTQTMTIRPSIRFSDRWSLMNSLSYLQVSSKINLIPLSTDPNIGEALPYTTVEPDVRTLFLQSTLSGQVRDNLSIKFRYHMRNYQNDTLLLTPLPAYVQLEEEVQYPQTPVYLSYRLQDYNLETAYRPWHRLSFIGGLRLKKNARSQREVSEYRENNYYITVRGSLSDRLTGEGGFSFSRGHGDRYQNQWYKTVFDPDPKNQESQHPLLRALDLAAYQSHELKVGVLYLPWDEISLGIHFQNSERTYPDTEVGRTSTTYRTTTLDVQYTPRPDWTSYAQYTQESEERTGRYTWSFDQDLLSPPQDLTFKDFRKPRQIAMTDQTDTLLLGIQYQLARYLALDASFTRAHSTGSDILSPIVDSLYKEFSFNATYTISKTRKTFAKDLAVALSYHLERYETSDFALRNFPGPGAPPSVAPTQDLYLGIRDPGYTAHITAITLSFTF